MSDLHFHVAIKATSEINGPTRGNTSLYSMGGGWSVVVGYRKKHLDI